MAVDSVSVDVVEHFVIWILLLMPWWLLLVLSDVVGGTKVGTGEGDRSNWALSLVVMGVCVSSRGHRELAGGAKGVGLSERPLMSNGTVGEFWLCAASSAFASLAHSHRRSQLALLLLCQFNTLRTMTITIPRVVCNKTSVTG